MLILKRRHFRPVRRSQTIFSCTKPIATFRCNERARPTFDATLSIVAFLRAEREIVHVVETLRWVLSEDSLVQCPPATLQRRLDWMLGWSFGNKTTTLLF